MGITHFGVSSDGAIFVPPNKVGLIGGTWTLTRNAAGNYSQLLSAAGETDHLIIPLDRGIRLASFDLIYSIGTADLTTHTAAIYRNSFVSGSAASVATFLSPTAVAKVQTTNIKVANTKIPTPTDLGVTADTLDFIEVEIVNPGTSVYDFYGAVLYGRRAI